MATHALALLLACMRNVVRCNRAIQKGRWCYTSAAKIPLSSNLTLGILGMGRISNCFAHHPYLIDGDFPAYVEQVCLDGLFDQADAISIHCLLNDETRGLVGEANMQVNDGSIRP